jgi:hypothetical protein
MTHPADASNDSDSDPAGNPATPSSPLTLEPPWAAEIGALFLGVARRLATDEQYRLAIQKMLV